MEQLTVPPDDLRIRPYGLADRDRVLRMSDRLSSDSLYTRFSSGTPRLPRHYLALLDGLDHWDRDALVALDGDEIVAIAEYVRHRKRPRRADIAVLVTDPWQRLGIGTVLVAYLAELAARRGITEFDADVVPSNTGAVRLIRRGWPAVRSTWEGGLTHFHLPLPV
ncbi:acetyltransferase (GNAT) family protein [Actinomadura pelletieri DSM 43383]|uniref:Acetyltransferase (GNAT) family protein n=1 Tax=Actinomadura pelletieri DSM 43383 TaxID=1120940 RepID=A0A495QZQ7_9ACTN|nr:GNAT family N-acetyltransferase [Actinomadura pelletieri]RKS79444.1 acetyltransferase (GNAT) family protein [Actinomadura pelletieri DSM 43383]